MTVKVENNPGPNEKILVSFPGKLGDLIYTLPAVRSLARFYRTPVYYQTSDYCRAAVELVDSQPFIRNCFLDQAYRLEHDRYGCQPYRMSEPPGFDRIFHLGFRPDLLGASVLRRPLVETFPFMLAQVYGLSLKPDHESAYLMVEAAPPTPTIAFQGFGLTLMDMMDPQAQARLVRFWKELFRRLEAEVLVLSGQREKEYYRGWGLEVLTPSSLLETARIIKRSRCFVGVQSAAAALADGLKVGRLIFRWFENALPTGPNAMTFSLDADPVEAAEAVNKLFVE